MREVLRHHAVTDRRTIRCLRRRASDRCRGRARSSGDRDDRSGARVAVVERGVQRAIVAPEYGVPLLREERGSRSRSGEPRQRTTREQQRTPPEIRSIQSHGRRVAFGLRRRSRAAGVSTRDGSIVERRERANQPIVTWLPDEADLRELRKAPLSERHALLRVATRRKREIGQCREERSGKRFVEPSHERRIQPDTGRVRNRHAVPKTSMRKEMIVLALVPRSVGEQATR